MRGDCGSEVSPGERRESSRGREGSRGAKGHLSGLGVEWKSMNGQRSSAEVEGWREVEGRSSNGLEERSSNGVEERS